MPRPSAVPAAHRGCAGVDLGGHGLVLHANDAHLSILESHDVDFWERMCTMAADAQTHLETLKERGYTVIVGGTNEAALLLAAVRRINDNCDRGADIDQPFLNRGHNVLYNLQREDLIFTRAFSGNTLLMEILCGLLNDDWYKIIPINHPNFIFRAIAGRSSGKAILPLHIDSFVPSSSKYCFACQVAVILEDQTSETGCTLVVPYSHLSDSYAVQTSMSEATPLETKAGDIVIWDSRLWHGALGNKTEGKSRWSLIATFTRWWLKQHFDITGTLPQEIYEVLTEDEKVMLGYCSMPPRDEFQRIDIKSGYAHLKPLVSDYGQG